jgi:hypothetical protein
MMGFGRFIAWLILAALPLQGMAAASMRVCGFGPSATSLSLSEGSATPAGFDRPVLSIVEGLNPNEHFSPFSLSLSKGHGTPAGFDRLVLSIVEGLSPNGGGANPSGVGSSPDGVAAGPDGVGSSPNEHFSPFSLSLSKGPGADAGSERANDHRSHAGSAHDHHASDSAASHTAHAQHHAAGDSAAPDTLHACIVCALCGHGATAPLAWASAFNLPAPAATPGWAAVRLDSPSLPLPDKPPRA